MRPLLSLFLAILFAVACDPRAAEPARPATPPRPATSDPAGANAAAQNAAATQTAKPSLQTRTGRADKLEYFEVVTGGADQDALLPMVIAIHGLGDEPEHFSGLLTDLNVRARFIFPRALDPYQDGYSWFPLRARSTDVGKLSEGITRAAHAIADAVRQLVDDRPTRGRPIVTGFSQGGMLSFAVATLHPQLFSAAFPVGGWLPPPLWPKGIGEPQDYPQIVALHGDEDVAVALGPTQESVATLRQLGLNAELHVYPGIGHAISPTMRDELHDLLRAALERV